MPIYQEKYNIRITILLTEKIMKQLQKIIAKKSETSRTTLSDIVRDAILFYIKQYEEENKQEQ
jgi:metal-responsive CopG/Arc/MetJ family transcriptional regulator